MLYETQTSRTIVYDHRLIAGTMGIIFAAVNQCYPSESGVHIVKIRRETRPAVPSREAKGILFSLAA